MEITGIDTVTVSKETFKELGDTKDRHHSHYDIVFVRVRTDDEITGFGETYPRPGVDAELVHEQLAPDLLGADPRNVERLWNDIYKWANYHGGYGGAEMRGLSAVDIALWDIKGKDAGIPIYQLLGGKTRERVPTYNTVGGEEDRVVEEPVELARSLLDDGITAMKIWPYDNLGSRHENIAAKTNGQYISPADLKAGAEPIRLIKEEFGDEMDVGVEFHGQWNVACAKRIANHLEQYDPMWLEELLPLDDVTAYDEVARSTTCTMNVSERIFTKYQYNTLFQTVDVDVPMLDVEWIGGFTEARKVAGMAEANHLPITLHSPFPPLMNFANLQLAAATPNLMNIESVRSYYDGWHDLLLTNTVDLKDGEFSVPEGPGLGTELVVDLFELESVDLRTSEA